MNKITTVTLNPAIDKSTAVDSLIPEKKLKCSEPKFEPGGGGVNVSRAIHHLGGTSTAIYLSGGYSGAFFNRLLQDEQINILPVSCKGHTRENLIVIESSTGKQYRFGMPGPKIEKEEWESVLEAIKKTDGMEYLVVSGSIPDGAPENIFKSIAQITKQKKIRCIADTSGKSLRDALDEGMFLVKPNLNELCNLSGKDNLTMEEIPAIAKAFIRSGNCEYMVVSLGAKGAILVSESESIHMIPPQVQSISTVGAGDSMMAGITWCLASGKSIHEAVKFGIACGTAATLNPGTELCHKKDAEEIFLKVKEIKIN